METRARKRIIYLTALAAVSAAGCGGPKMHRADISRMPLREATATELVALINGRADSIRGVKADLDLSFRKLPEGKPKGCRGKLVSIRGARSVSSSIYLKGYKRLMPTFFTLVSDGGEFWLHVPKRNTVYTGPVERTGPAEPAGDDTTAVDLEAMDLARALFVEPVDMFLAVEMILDEEHYILSVSEGGTLRRRLRIERRMFSVVGEIFYNEQGVEELELVRADYSSAAGISYPLKTVIVKPHSGREITLELRELVLNPDNVKSAAFSFEPPRGARIERLE